MLGRRVSAGGRTSAFVAGRAASRGRPETARLARLLAFFGQHEHRKLTISSAQLEVLDGFAGAEHLQLRERYREAHRECPRLAAELAELRERDGSRERDLDLYRDQLTEIEASRPIPPSPRRSPPQRERLRHAEGLREAAAGAHSAALGVDEDGGGAAGALAQAEALLQGVAGVDASLDALSAPASAPWRSSSATSPASCAITWRDWRPIPVASPRSRSGSRRSTACSASTVAVSSRCSPTPSAAGRRSSAWRTRASAAPRRRRRWPRPKPAAPSSPPS